MPLWMLALACRLGATDTPSDSPADSPPDSPADSPGDSPVDSPVDTGQPDLGPDAECTELGCLRSAEVVGSFTREQIEAVLAPGTTLDNGYQAWTIAYLTESGEALATVTLPQDLREAAPAAGFPIVANNHGTIGVSDLCALSGTEGGLALAALFGAYGSIGVAPDYPGLGTSAPHLYLNAREEATSALDALRAAAQLAHWQEVPTSDRYAMVGLSQGGHATLSAAAIHADYAPELDIRAFAASGPASLYEEHWRSGVAVNGGHMVYHALLAWSFSQGAGVDDAAIWGSAVADIVDARMEGRCLWNPDFGSAPLLTDGFPVVSTQVFSAAYLSEYSSGSWSQFAHIHQGFEDNRIRPWLAEGETQTADLAIFQGTLDAVIPLSGTRELVTDLRAGGVQVELFEVEGGTHTTTAYGFLGSQELARSESMAWVMERLD